MPAKARDINTAAVVADLDDHLGALMKGVQGDGAASRLRGSEALLGRLDAVVDGITNDVRQGFRESVENALVEIGVLTGDLEGHVLAALLGDVPDDAWKTAEELADRHHANLQHGLVQFVEDAGLKLEGIDELCANRILGVLLVELSEGTVQHGLADNQLADEIHYRVDAGGFDAKGAFGNGGNGGAGARLSGARGRGRLNFALFRILFCFGFKEFAEKLMIAGLGGGGALDANFRDDGRNAATALDGGLRLGAREGSFHDFDGRCGGVVLGTKRDDGATAVKDVSNQLKSRGAHAASGIDAERHVKHRFAAMKRFGNHQQLVLAPIERCGKLWSGNRRGLRRVNAFG